MLIALVLEFANSITVAESLRITCFCVLNALGTVMGAPTLSRSLVRMTRKKILNKNCDGIRTPRSGKVDSWQQITLMLRRACATRRMDELRSSQSRALCPCGTGEKPTCAMPRCRKDTDVHAQPTTLA